MATKDAVAKLTVADQMRMQAILLDRDKDDALEFVKMLHDHIEADGKQGLRSHLDS
jgi:hypothetical protein